MTDNPKGKPRLDPTLSDPSAQQPREILGDVSASAKASLGRSIKRKKFRRHPDFQQRLAATIDLATSIYEQHGVRDVEHFSL